MKGWRRPYLISIHILLPLSQYIPHPCTHNLPFLILHQSHDLNVCSC